MFICLSFSYFGESLGFRYAQKLQPIFYFIEEIVCLLRTGILSEFQAPHSITNPPQFEELSHFTFYKTQRNTASLFACFYRTTKMRHDMRRHCKVTATNKYLRRMATSHRAAKREVVAAQLNRLIEKGNKCTRTGCRLILSQKTYSRGRRSSVVASTKIMLWTFDS